MNRRNAVAAALSTLAAGPGLSFAQGAAWPDKTVRIILPFAPGGQTDAVARIVATKLGEKFHQPFVVENRPGGGGMVATEFVARAAPDGYTLVFTSASISVNTTLLAGQFKFDPVKDLTPIIWAASEPLVLVVPAALKAQNVTELVAMSKTSKNGLNGAFNGSGTTSQVALEMFRQQTGARLTPVPYKGGGPSALALLAGEVDLCFATLATVKPHIDTGKLRALAVTTARPSSVLPGVPTMMATYPDFESDNWFGLMGPRGVPAEVVKKLNAAASEALKAPDSRATIGKTGGEVVASSPEEFAKHLDVEINRYAKVIKAGNIKPE